MISIIFKVDSYDMQYYYTKITVSIMFKVATDQRFIHKPINTQR